MEIKEGRADARRNALVGWSIFTSVAIVIFWAIWYFLNGSVPVISEIKITDNWSYTLPFTVSRWWDVMIGPLWSVALISTISRPLPEEIFPTINSGLTYGLVSGLIFGSILVLGLELIFAPSLGPILEIIIGSSAGLVLSFIFDEPRFGPIFGPGSKLVFALSFGLGIGPGYGLYHGLAQGLIYGLISGLILILSIGPSHKMQKIWMNFWQYSNEDSPYRGEDW